jgi:dTDP-4-dehydrorhamnose 3,5-epimerase-like enzyme
MNIIRIKHTPNLCERTLENNVKEFNKEFSFLMEKGINTEKQDIRRIMIIMKSNVTPYISEFFRTDQERKHKFLGTMLQRNISNFAKKIAKKIVPEDKAKQREIFEPLREDIFDWYIKFITGEKKVSKKVAALYGS